MKQERNSIIEKNNIAGCCVQHISGMVFHESSNVDLIMKEVLPILEDDLQGFPNKETSRSKILDTVCAMRCSENFDKIILKNGYKMIHDACELGFQHMTVMDIVNAAAKQKGKEEDGEDESKEKGEN
jgi:hypothetical protein